MAKQVGKSGAALKKAVQIYNDQNFSAGLLPKSVKFLDVANPEAPIFGQISVSRTAFFPLKGSIVGQSLAKRMARQVGKSGATLKKAEKGYNDQKIYVGSLPNTVKFPDVANPEASIFRQISVSRTVPPPPPPAPQRLKSWTIPG